MKKYIRFSKDDLEKLNKGEVVIHTLEDGQTIRFVLDDVYASNTISEGDWTLAYDHLNHVIAEYMAMRINGAVVLQQVLMPLKRRYDMGERTRSLYDHIMLYY